MVIAIFAALIVIGLDIFLRRRRRGDQAPVWYLIALSIIVLAIAAIVVLWVGEYRFEHR
jgi:heme/copper-type cytochrome/quinol oxidase subunit 2